MPFFQKSIFYTECDECDRRFPVTSGGVCVRCKRILCTTHLHGSLGRRIAIGADHDPVFLSCDNAPLHFRDDDSRRGQPIRSGVEYDPAAIRGEARAVDPVPRMLQPAVVVRRADLQDPHA